MSGKSQRDAILVGVRIATVKYFRALSTSTPLISELPPRVRTIDVLTESGLRGDAPSHGVCCDVGE